MCMCRRPRDTVDVVASRVTDEHEYDLFSNGCRAKKKKILVFVCSSVRSRWRCKVALLGRKVLEVWCAVRHPSNTHKGRTRCDFSLEKIWVASHHYYFGTFQKDGRKIFPHKQGFRSCRAAPDGQCEIQWGRNK
jgi:hypothetical protein